MPNQSPKASHVEDSSPVTKFRNNINTKFNGKNYVGNEDDNSIRNNTSSAVLATESNPMYEKKTVEAPASIPSTPNGKYLSVNMSNKKSEELLLKETYKI